MIDEPKNPRTWRERIEALLTRVQAMAGAALANFGVLANRVQQVAASGAVVAAAGAITPDANLTTIGANGRVRITANFSGVGGGGAGGIHAFLQVQIGAGPNATVFSWAPVATGGVVDGAGTSLVINTGAPAGTVVAVHWQTTAGDDAVTLGGVVGAGVDGASLLVEQVL